MRILHPYSKNKPQTNQNRLLVLNRENITSINSLLISSIKILIIKFLYFFCLKTNGQTDVKSSSHIEETKATEFSFNAGSNHYGLNASLYYYYRENVHFKLYAGYRNFNYKSYSENILETGLEIGLLYGKETLEEEILDPGLDLFTTGLNGHILGMSVYHGY